ncbi:MAG: hypothetical protein ACPLKP_03355 [Microgenomates group bacterium]
MVKIIKNETLLVLLISFLALTISFSPTIYEFFASGKLADSRRIFLGGEHNHTYDYNVYLAKMRQGAEGRWTVINKYSTEPHQGSLLQEFYLLSGKVGGIFGFSPALTYHFLRLLLGAILLLAIYWLGSWFFSSFSSRIAFFLLALFSGSLPRFGFWEGKWHPMLWLDWWQEMDQIKRITYVPHYLLGHLGTVIGLLAFLKYWEEEKNQKKWFFLATGIGFLAGFVHPPSLLILWGIFGFIFLEKFISQRKFSLIFPFLFFYLLTSLPLIYIQWITHFYPWKSVVDYDRAHPWLYSFYEVIFAHGLTLFLGILGSFFVFFQKLKKFYPLIWWWLTALGGMIIFRLTGLHSELYWIQTALHLPFAGLTVFLLGKTKKIIPLTLIILSLSLPGIYASLKGQFQFINQRLAAFLPLVPYPSQVMYPLKDWWEAIKWLEKNTSDEEVVLSGITAGNYIPAYAGNFVYLGHFTETVDFERKNLVVRLFFSGQMGEKEAKDFLKKNKIAFVFWGPQEKEFGDFKPFSFLKPVFTSEYVTLFQVENE